MLTLSKKVCRDKPGNYRPVNLMSAVGKLLENILKERIYLHLEWQGLIRDSQHGFVRGRSCLMNLIESFVEVTRCVDEGSVVDVVYMDFSKTFDKVPHGRLVKNVNSYGIQGNLRKWIQNWLSCRRQRVMTEGSLRDWKPVSSGVPQGSVL